MRLGNLKSKDRPYENPRNSKLFTSMASGSKQQSKCHPYLNFLSIKIIAPVDIIVSTASPPTRGNSQGLVESLGFSGVVPVGAGVKAGDAVWLGVSSKLAGWEAGAAK